MKFKNYCIVVMGETVGVQTEIQKISEITPNILDAKGILIATFASILEPNELTEWFKQNQRNFMIFELKEGVSGFNINKKEIHEGLFGFLKIIDNDVISDEFLSSIDLSSSTLTKVTKKNKSSNRLNEELINKMGRSEREDLFNELIDYGLDKLSEDDKKLLPLLIK